MTGAPETLPQAAGGLRSAISPADPGDPTTGRRRPGRSRATAVLAVASLVILLGVLTYLIVLAQPFADATGGCGGG